MTDQTLREATGALGIEVPTLMGARARSLQILDETRERLTASVPPEGIEADVLALGSLARLEASRESDFDYLVVMHRLPSDVRTGRRLIDAAEDVRTGLDLEAPGRTGLFARVISAPDLTENIGLEDDTNITHSLRILTLEESASVYRPDLHEQLLRAILDRYLADAEGARVPRFLINDVIRYWRTLAVDYQAKRWKSLEPGGWGLRYLKLIISRKLTFAGTLASLFLIEPPTTDGLLSQFELPSLSRLAQLHEHLDDDRKEDLAAILQIADEFLAHLGDERFREEAQQVRTRSEIRPGSRFADMRDQARRLQEHLEGLFFDSEVLGEKTRRYLSF